MTKKFLPRILAICEQDDHLKEGWLWAQAVGVAIATAILGSVLLSISNFVVISYTGVMARICALEFDLTAYTAWQENAGAIACSVGLAVACLGVFCKLWLSACYGSAVVKKRWLLALDSEESIDLCQSLLPSEASIVDNFPKKGMVTLHLNLGQTKFTMRHAVLRVIPVDDSETEVLLDVIPELKGQWGLVSAFFSDFGANREQAEIIHCGMLPYLANARKRPLTRKPRKGLYQPTRDDVQREAPPKLVLTASEMTDHRRAWGRRKIG